MRTLSFPGTTLRWGSGSILSFTETRPAVMMSSAALREATPAAAKIYTATTALCHSSSVCVAARAACALRQMPLLTLLKRCASTFWFLLLLVAAGLELLLCRTKETV